MNIYLKIVITIIGLVVWYLISEMERKGGEELKIGMWTRVIGKLYVHMSVFGIGLLDSSTYQRIVSIEVWRHGFMLVWKRKTIIHICK